MLTPSSSDKQSSLSHNKEALTEDDHELFLKAVEGVSKIVQKGRPSSAMAVRKNSQSSSSASLDQEKQLFLRTMQDIGTTEIIPKEGQKNTVDVSDQGRRSMGRRMKLLKRGTIRIMEELDLHGYSRDEALNRLKYFIISAFDRELEAVLIITGKGINSAEGPVLQGAVATWLRMSGKNMVAEFSPAPRDRGGKGALVVFLRKK